jgi:hypothetical protein
MRTVGGICASRCAATEAALCPLEPTTTGARTGNRPHPAQHREQRGGAEALEEMAVHLARQARAARKFHRRRAQRHADPVGADQAAPHDIGPRLPGGQAALVLADQARGARHHHLRSVEERMSCVTTARTKPGRSLSMAVSRRPGSSALRYRGGGIGQRLALAVSTPPPAIRLAKASFSASALLPVRGWWRQVWRRRGHPSAAHHKPSPARPSDRAHGPRPPERPAGPVSARQAAAATALARMAG